VLIFTDDKYKIWGCFNDNRRNGEFIRSCYNKWRCQNNIRQDPKSLKIDLKGASGKPVIKLKNSMYENEGKNSAIGTIGDGINTINVKTNSGDFTVK